MPGEQSRPRVLFLCMHNSCRSQMAEALLRHLAGDRFEAASAGIERRGVHPLAIRALEEIGAETDGLYSKTMVELAGQHFDVVVTTCDEAQEACPRWPGAAAMLHWGFPDPSAAEGADEERMAVFREVRDAVAARVKAFLAERA